MNLKLVAVVVVVVAVVAVAAPLAYFLLNAPEKPPEAPGTTVRPQNLPPLARMGASATRALHGAEVRFNANGSSDPDGDLLTYNWDFGDGDGANGLEVIHQFQEDGAYEVTLTVSDGSLTNSTSMSIYIYNGPPVIRSSSPTGASISIFEGESVLFSVSAEDPNDDPLTCSWLVDGQFQPVTAMTFNYTTNATSAGERRVTASVSDGFSNATREWSVSVRNLNRPPAISSFEPGPGCTVSEGEPLELRATAADPDGDDLTFVWVMDGIVKTNGTGSTATFTYEPDFHANGTHLARVTFSDGPSTVSQNWTVLVKNTNRPPSVSGQSPDPFCSVPEGETAQFVVLANDPDADDLAFSWSLDGAPRPESSTSVFTLYTNFSSNGTYRLSVDVSDGQYSAGANWTITVTDVNRAPTARARVDRTEAFIGEDFSFDASQSFDPDGDELTCEWDFGDGTGASGVNATHSFAVAGVYTVNLTVTDPGGLSSRSGLSVTAKRGLQQAWSSGPLYERPVELLVADVDADGLREYIVATDSGEDGGGFSHGNISIFDLATGALEWSSQDLGSPSGVVVTNLDGDPQLELVVGVTLSRTGTLLDSQFDGMVLVIDGKTHLVEWQGPSLGAVTSVAVADVDNDGQKDILAAYTAGYTVDMGTGILSGRGGLAIYDSAHDVMWESTGWGATEILAAELLDLDQLPELLVFTASQVNIAGGTGNVSNLTTYKWLLGGLVKIGTFADIANLYPSAVEIADVNGDGTKDILFGDSAESGGTFSGFLYVFSSTMNQLWVSTDIGGVMVIEVGDVDPTSHSVETMVGIASSRDPSDDLHGSMIMFSSGWGVIWRTEDIGSVEALATGDLNADGKLELLLGVRTHDDGFGDVSCRLIVYSLQTHKELANATGLGELASALVLLDTDSDGTPEILFAEWRQIEIAGYVRLYGM